jgi:hypothetical protein
MVVIPATQKTKDKSRKILSSRLAQTKRAVRPCLKKKKTRIKMKRTGVTAHVVETPLACVRPWIQSLAPHTHTHTHTHTQHTHKEF